jgi:prolyl 4-hydroxylase
MTSSIAQPTATFADVGRLAQAGRLNEAFELIIALADREDPEALITLGDFYWQGGPVDQDPQRARALFERASDVGHPMGRIFFTNLLASGVYGERDWSGAVVRLESEAGLDPHRALALQTLRSMSLDAEGNPSGTFGAESLSDKLGVFLHRGLFTEAECDFVLASAERRYQRSAVQDAQGRETPHPLRSSDGAPLHWLIEDPALQALNRRLAAVTQTPYENAEPLLVLRYHPGQEYRRHFDALPGLANQRSRTALVYLNDDYAGGETAFPRLDLKVRGRKGDVLVFHNSDAEGSPLPFSEHAGLPVVSGVKYLASRWIRSSRHLP